MVFKDLVLLTEVASALEGLVIQKGTHMAPVEEFYRCECVNELIGN